MQAGRMGSLLQWNLTAGVFLLIGFTSALEGPKEKAGFLGRPLSLMCTYSKGYKDNVKYWCQGNNWGSCIIVVKTDGTEAEVKAGRTFIKDNQTSFQFTVTLEKLTEEDAGTYWCGIEIGGRDYGFPVTIIVLPGFTSALKGPEVVAGFLGRPLSLMCTYSKDYKDYVKYWCQGNNWDSCTIVVKTDGTEAEAKAGRTFIKDNQTSFQFTVTLEKLTEEDAGTYWCGIEIVGRDFGFRVTITVLPAPTTVAVITTSVPTQPNIPIITTERTLGTRPALVTTEKSNSPELSGDSFSCLDPSYISYLMRVSFLISVGLKMPILLCLVFAMGWIYRRKRWSSHQLASETPHESLKKATL